MQKEKKAVVKNSKYYYRKAQTQDSILRIFGPSMILLFTGMISLGLMTKDNVKKQNSIVEESGYKQFIQEEKALYKRQYIDGEISYRVYTEYVSDVEDITFEGYLKLKDKEYYLAEYNQTKKEIGNCIDATMATMIILGSSIVALSAAEITRASLVTKKAQKLEKKEKEEAECLKVWRE